MRFRAAIVALPVEPGLRERYFLFRRALVRRQTVRMSEPLPAPLGDERYVSLETFRKDGTGVKTPVWAAPLDGHLVILTDGTSYKVKRLRNNARVRVAPCDVRGRLRGAWLDGTARILDDQARIALAHRALRRKYGFLAVMTDFFARVAGRISRRAYLEVTL
jgi:PPOX class probable F420-dependent enzyme